MKTTHSPYELALAQREPAFRKEYAAAQQGGKTKSPKPRELRPGRTRKNRSGRSAIGKAVVQ